MTPITERSENLICVAPLQQSILSVAFVRNSVLILTEPASGLAYHPIHFFNPHPRGSLHGTHASPPLPLYRFDCNRIDCNRHESERTRPPRFAQGTTGKFRK